MDYYYLIFKSPGGVGYRCCNDTRPRHRELRQGWWHKKFVRILLKIGTPTRVEFELRNEAWDVYRQLGIRLRKFKKEIAKLEGRDGECFFRAFAHQFFNDAELHPFVRAATIMFMREHPELYAEDFSRMFAMGTYSQFLDAMSHPLHRVGDLIIQGACDAFSVTITRLFSFGTNVMSELHPKNMVYHRELFMSCLPNHIDSMFNAGELPAPIILSKARIEEIRTNGAVRYQDVAGGCVCLFG